LNLSASAVYQGDYGLAETRCTQGLHLAHLIGDSFQEGFAYRVLGDLYTALGNYAKAQQFYDQSLQLARALGARQEENELTICLSFWALAQDQVAGAEQYARNALQDAQALGSPRNIHTAWVAFGWALLQRSNYEAAAQAFQHLLALTTSEQPVAVNAWVGLAQVALLCGDTLQSHQYVNEILRWLQIHPPSRLYDVSGAYLLCYQVLTQQQPDRAIEVLEVGYQLIQHRVTTINDPAERQRYLQNVRSNRALIAARQARLNQT
jgi:ATP/maltotriose-dependent transcriptional regulator MalT